MSKDKLTKKQQKELQKLTDELINEASLVFEDYEENLSSETSGSVIEIHEDSPYLVEKKYRLIKFNEKSFKTKIDKKP